jgi:hypothetical protein
MIKILRGPRPGNTLDFQLAQQQRNVVRGVYTLGAHVASALAVQGRRRPANAACLSPSSHRGCELCR